MSKSIFSLLSILFFIALSARGQEISVTTMDYQVLIPQADDVIKEGHYMALAERIKQQFKNRVSFSNQSAFYIKPKVNILSEMTAGEVQDTKVLKLEIIFTLENPDLNVTFNTYSKKIIVNADSRELAIQKAILEIRPNDKNLIAFLERGEQLIKNFYTENCVKIIQSTKVKIDRKEYAAAFAMLCYVPEGLACSAEVRDIITAIYQHYKDEYCAKQLHDAQMLTAKESYNRALVSLQYIDPRASCHQEVTTLLRQIGEKVNQETMRKFEMDKSIFEKRSELEKMKLLISSVDEINLHVQN